METRHALGGHRAARKGQGRRVVQLRGLERRWVIDTHSDAIPALVHQRRPQRREDLACQRPYKVAIDVLCEASKPSASVNA